MVSPADNSSGGVSSDKSQSSGTSDKSASSQAGKTGSERTESSSSKKDSFDAAMSNAQRPDRAPAATGTKPNGASPKTDSRDPAPNTANPNPAPTGHLDPGLTPEQSKTLADSAAVMNGYAMVPSYSKPDLAQRAKEAVLDTGELLGGVGVGAAIATKDMVVGTTDFAWEGAKAVVDYPGALMNKAISPTGFSPFEAQERRHDQRMQAGIDFVTSIPDMPGQALEAAKLGWQTFDKNWDTGNYYAAGKQIGSLGAEAAAIAVPVAKAGSLSKIGRIDDVARANAIDQRLDQMYSVAPTAKAEIDELAGTIATKHGGHVAEAPLKSRRRATEKTILEYDGNASQIKDLARNTIIVPKDKIDSVMTELREHGARVKQITPELDPAGYSGVNAVVDTKAGIKAEIQINTPEMIYAKEPELDARGILGDEVYDGIADRTGIPGGRGHALYEQARILSDTELDRAREIDLESREYYKNFQ